jgi:hypothetical protein
MGKAPAGNNVMDHDYCASSNCERMRVRWWYNAFSYWSTGKDFFQISSPALRSEHGPNSLTTRVRSLLILPQYAELKQFLESHSSRLEKRACSKVGRDF